MASGGVKRNHFATAVAFLLPNFIGVLAFVIFPVAFSILLAFTNWDLRHHNMFKDDPLQFIGLNNFIRLLTEEEFLRFLGNTLFLMLGIPFATGGALLAALLLSKDTRGPDRRTFLLLLSGTGFIASIVLLTLLGMNATAMVILLGALAGGILLTGVCGGVMFYRTLFYMPHLTAGVATLLIWKKLFNPQFGPINTTIQPMLNKGSGLVTTLPSPLVQFGFWLLLCMIVLLMAYGIARVWRMWNDGDWGSITAGLTILIMCVPLLVASRWQMTSCYSLVIWLALLMIIMCYIARIIMRGRDFNSSMIEGIGSGIVFGAVVLVGQFICLGLAPVLRYLPEMAADGLVAPGWFYSYHWAKPTFIMIGLWGALGSNNMLLYLAALMNVPQDLYDAADIDGADRLHRFWHVTWPQLAPTTFFIAVMSTIGGLQGGFDMARVLTQGGPAGATTTLSYFIYQEGFQTGRLSFSSAVSWALFVLIFVLTMFTWKFGNRYVND